MFKHSKHMKLFAALLAAVMLISLVACGNASSTGETQNQQKQTETTAAKADNPGQTEASATSQQETANAGAQPEADTAKTLVVFFSATGTTKGVAEQIASVSGADTYEILAAETYTADDLNWNDQNSRTTIEQNDKSVRPAIGSETISLDGYSVIFLGYPIWWGGEPRIMDTFVESYDFTGKTVIPFCTSGGSGIGASGTNLAANAGSGSWLEGQRLSSSSDIAGWVNSFDL